MIWINGPITACGSNGRSAETALMKRGSPSPDLEGSATPATKRLSGADDVSRCSSWMIDTLRCRSDSVAALENESYGPSCRNFRA